MDLGLDGKVVIIAGSSRGLGKVTAHKFLGEGARVMISGRDPETLRQATEELTALFPDDRVASFCGDLLQEAEVRAYLDSALSHWSRIDVAVANIGSGRGEPFRDADEAEWQRVFQLNLFGGMQFVRQVLACMAAGQGGSICLVSSIAGMEALAAPTPYTAAKAGVMAATKSLARASATDNVRINVVSPGNVLFPDGDWDRKLQADPEETRTYIDAEVPMKRFAAPEEVAACIVFLSSSQASFVTGASLLVDGGQTRAI